MHAASQAIEPQRQSHVSNETDQLHTVVERLTNAVDQLRSRLAPVLRSEPPHPIGSKDSAVAEVLVPVAEGIRNARIQVSNTVANVESLLARLEA